MAGIALVMLLLGSFLMDITESCEKGTKCKPLAQERHLQQCIRLSIHPSALVCKYATHLFCGQMQGVDFCSCEYSCDQDAFQQQMWICNRNNLGLIQPSNQTLHASCWLDIATKFCSLREMQDMDFCNCPKMTNAFTTKWSSWIRPFTTEFCIPLMVYGIPDWKSWISSSVKKTSQHEILTVHYFF